MTWRRLCLLMLAGLIACGVFGAGITANAAPPASVSRLATSPEASPTAAAPVPKGIPEGSEQATVVSYKDAHTLIVSLASGHQATVVLIGVDVPNPKKGSQGECFAQQSLSGLKKIVKVGTVVFLESDTVEKDAAKHLLTYMWIPAKKGPKPSLVNQTMIRSGYAAYAETNGNTKHADVFQASQDHAKTEALGIWKECGGPHKLIVAPPTPTPTTDELKAQYQPLDDVRELNARPAGMFGDKISFTGTIYLIQEAPTGRVYTLGDTHPKQFQTFIGIDIPAPDGSTVAVVVGFDGDTTGMFDGSYVIVYGTVIDTATGTNAFGGSVTNPLIDAKFVEFAS